MIRRLQPDEDQLVKELDGYVELGMPGEALQAARNLLNQPDISPEQFGSAADAILIQADKTKPWRGVLETAFSRLSKTGQRAVRDKMFGFYVTLEDWDAAHRFLPKRPVHAAELLFSMWTLLNLNKPAKLVQRQCLRALKSADEPFALSNLLEALASYHAHQGELDAAEHYWKQSAGLEPFAHKALAGLVEIAAVRGQLLAKAGLLQIEKFRKEGVDEEAVILPNNRGSALEKAARDLKRYQTILQKIVPPRKLRDFGVDPEDV